MGFSGNYCSLCGCPLVDAYAAWYEKMGDKWPPEEDTGRYRPYPTKTADETVTISQRDGDVWADAVVLSRYFADNGFVNKGRSRSGFNMPDIDGEEGDWWEEEDAEPNIILHRICLSLLCRRLDTSPEGVWRSFFPAAHIVERSYPDWPLYVQLEIGNRQGQEFQFMTYHIRKLDDNKWDRWYDTSRMEECGWLLARPTVFPKLTKASNAVRLPPGAPCGTTSALALRVLGISELFTHVMSFLESPPLANYRDASPARHPHVLRAYAALQRTSRAFHALIAGRQDIYFALVRAAGWMLPVTPRDWAEWKAAGNPATIELAQWDWKAYVAVFVTLEDPHVRSRWRVERSVLQFGVPSEAWPSVWPGEMWAVGTVEKAMSLEEPEAFEWEDDPPEKDEDDEEEDA
ncbi:hypothetical protein FA95DRAFT_1564026 [Auriscalpium vulgare]|uniref:Uncharacterized protein n=1 Tax=Auriscalpium vulgare TaxID=40419 RepID=A0ACB8RFG4_9AGAM|nr:hypothetical protein FA95DRAFT_1564026 [Auriscalpium vulgare]